MKKSLLILTALLTAGCISAPNGLEKDEFTLSSMRRISADDYACACRKVRLGGKVLKATALKTQTKIEVLSLPVASFSAKPVIDVPTDGRFVAYINGFVDPVSLQDQYITVLGVLKGKETGKIDAAEYQYPVINVTSYKQWRQRQEYDYEDDEWDYYYGYGRWGRPFPMMGGWRPEPKLRTVLY